MEERNEVSGEKAVEKPLRGKVQTTDFSTSLGNPQKPRIPTFPPPRRLPVILSRRTGEQTTSNPTSSQINLLQRKNGLDNGVHLPQRMSGQRRYDTTAPYRLAIIQPARQLGFTLTEIRHLFFGFRDIARPSERWRTLSQRKLAELDHLMDGIKAGRGVLKKLMTKCRCDTLINVAREYFRA